MLQESAIYLLFSVDGLLVSAIGLILVYLQLKKMNQQLNFDMSVVKRQKAMEMALEFSKLIEKELGYVSQIMSSDKEFQDIISNKNDHEYINFDQAEESKIYGYSHKDVEKIMNPESYSLEVLYKIYFAFYIKENEKAVYYRISANKFDLNATIEADKNIELNVMDFHNRVLRTFDDTTLFLLNKLEWWSMNFIQKLADEDIVYQSLHQMYLKTCELLYFKIVRYNEGDTTEKYFTNVIALYVMWKERKLQLDYEIKRVHDEASDLASKKVMAKPKYDC